MNTLFRLSPCFMLLVSLMRPCLAANENLWVSDFDSNGIHSPLAESLLKKKHWGFINHSGEFVISPRYDLVKTFKNDTTTVGVGNIFFKIDRSGKVVSDLMNRGEVIRQSNELRWAKEAKDKAVAESRKYAGEIWNATGKIRIGNAKDFKLSGFSEGLAVCTVPEKFLPIFYSNLAPETSVNDAVTRSNQVKLSPFQTGNPDGFIDENGRMVVPPRYNNAGDFHDGIAVINRYSNLPGDGGEGYIDKYGRLLSGRYFGQAWAFKEGFGIVHRTKAMGTEDAWGFIDRSGHLLMGPWTEVYPFCGGIAGVHFRDGRWGFIDNQGKTIGQPIFQSVAYEFPEGLGYVKSEGKYGYVDRTRRFVISPQFADADSFSDGLAPVALDWAEQEMLKSLGQGQRWRCGFIDTTGNEVIAPHFYGAKHFSEGLAAVQVGLKWGFVNDQGKMVIAPTFDDARPFSEGLAAVLKNDRWGFIDKTGNFVIAPRFPAYSDTSGAQRCFAPPLEFAEELTLAEGPDFQCRFINKQGNEAFPLDSRMYGPWAKAFAEGLAVMDIFSDSGSPLYGYIDHTGKFQIDPKLESAMSFSEGLAAVKVTPESPAIKFSDVRHYKVPAWRSDLPDSKVGFINKNGEFVVPPQFDGSRSFKNGLAAVAHGDRPGKATPFVGKWGYIDKTGRAVSEEIFDDALDFSEGLAAVKSGSKWGFIDDTGALVIAPKFDTVKPFSHGLAAIKLEGKYGFISKNGELAIPAKYLLAGRFSCGRALVVFSSQPEPSVSTEKTNYSKPLQSDNDLLDFLQVHGAAPDDNSWAGHRH